MPTKPRRKTRTPPKKRGAPSVTRRRITSLGRGTGSKTKQTSTTPWYKRGKTLIISAGALAAAILGILSLWDRIFPPPDEDLARIESVHIIKRTPLTGFAGGGIGQDLPLAPVINQGGVAGLGVLPLPTVPAQAASTATLSLKPTPEPTPTPTPTTTSPTPTFTSPTPSPSPSSDSPTPTATTPPPTLSPEVLSGISSISEEYISSVTEQAPMQPYAPPASVYAARSLVMEAVDEKGEPLPPEEVAIELAQALEEVESTTSPEGEDPLGWTVAVRVDLEGLAQVPLLLTWSLDGLDVPDTWRAENLAYRVVGASPHDAGVAEIWVPDLKRASTYNVNIKLSFENNGLIADLHPLALPESGPVQGGG